MRCLCAGRFVSLLTESDYCTLKGAFLYYHVNFWVGLLRIINNAGVLTGNNAPRGWIWDFRGALFIILRFTFHFCYFDYLF